MRKTLLTLAMAVCALIALAVPSRTQADPPVASEYSHVCDHVETLVYPGSRVEVKCDSQWSNPSTGATAQYFATASGTALAGQVVSVALAAQTTSGKKVRIRFRTSSSENPSGCGGDCRKLVGIMLMN